jgi:uncharacterized protein YcsI (UPF0317 family)
MALTEEEASKMKPQEFRQYVRKGEFTTTTRNACPGYAHANLVVVPKELAYNFFLFCIRNPKPCPIVDVTEPGNPHPLLVAPEADLRTDLPKYKVFKDGELVAEPTDIMDYWRDDSVAFLLGCSYTQDWVFRSANIKYRLTGAFATNIPCIPASPFKGNLAVSCRMVKGAENVVRVIQVSSRYPQVHGAPVHLGDPEAIGIPDPYHSELSPYFASQNLVEEPGDIPLFFACGVTPQLVAVESKVPFLITHWTGHMFVTDVPVEKLAVF